MLVGTNGTNSVDCWSMLTIAFPHATFPPLQLS
jgi:hypothetical protein